MRVIVQMEFHTSRLRSCGAPSAAPPKAGGFRVRDFPTRSAWRDDLDGEIGVAARAVGPGAALAAKTEPRTRSNARRNRDLHVLESGLRVEADVPLATQLGLPRGERQPQGHVPGSDVR